MIAFFGGAAGIVALCTKGKGGNVIPGVAIATALMPPLCTAGFGLATGRWLFFLGAFYLFFINTVFIALATTLGVRLMKFHQHVFITTERGRHAKKVLVTIVVLTMIPAAVMTWQIVKNELLNNHVKEFVATELQQKGTMILKTDLNKDEQLLRVVAIGKKITVDRQNDARKHMCHYGLGHYQLRIIQEAQTDSMSHLNKELAQVSSNLETNHQQLLELSAANSELEQQLNDYVRYENLSQELCGEVGVLFPHIKTLSLAKTAEINSKTNTISHYTSAIISTHGHTSLGTDERHKLANWLKARIHADSLVVIEKHH